MTVENSHCVGPPDQLDPATQVLSKCMDAWIDRGMSPADFAAAMLAHGAAIVRAWSGEATARAIVDSVLGDGMRGVH